MGENGVCYRATIESAMAILDSGDLLGAFLEWESDMACRVSSSAFDGFGSTKGRRFAITAVA